MTAKTIPLASVQAALMCAKVRLLTRAEDGRRHGRAAAITQAPFWELTCKDRLRSGGRSSQRRAISCTFTVMHTGDMDEVLARVRLNGGLQEVRRTWGAGYRALQGEFGGCSIMR